MSKMPAKTLAALKGSIKHWEENAAAKVEDGSVKWTDCPLCVLVNGDEDGWESEDVCVGCPVMERTGRRYCGETPYHDASNATSDKNEGWWKSSALAELEFLRSLLPDEEKEKADESL